MIKRILAAICAVMLVLTGCGSDYSDAQVDVPANWAEYTVENMEFRFEAGWKSGNWDAVMAEADKQAAILKADGEAQAILAVQKALADSLALLNEKAPNDQVIKLKAIEAMQKVADGQATKIIVPSEIQNLAGLVTSVKEIASEK